MRSNQHTLVWTAGHCVHDPEFGGGFATNWIGVDLKEMPNGDLAYADGGTSIKRIVYTPGNGSPSADAAATPTSGPAPLPVQFASSGSSGLNRAFQSSGFLNP